MDSTDKNLREEALKYHSEGRPGKIEITPTKPHSTQRDLSLAYSPGVAEPCLEIEKDRDNAYKYTAKGNLVAVITNGTAILGLGNIGAIAGKPVMEGKGLLFKIFADIDVFDIEVGTQDTEEFISTVKNIAATFGGINLEDIKAPECFEIERRLRDELDIPVMHDDQHGTAIISSAAIMNALELVGKNLAEARFVVNGAGAAAVSCARMLLTIGVRRENMVMCDSKGVITERRTDLNAAKKEFTTAREISTLEEAIKEADVFLGLSVADVLTQDMIRSMASNPVVMALANPDPEITYEEAMSSREDIVFATGRSDYPNQVNNVLGFPYIFRGALDVRATVINDAMKTAAAFELAALAREPVPEKVRLAYGGSEIVYGREYLIPKPLDPRLISRIPVAVAKAAVESGVAKHVIADWEEYGNELDRRMGRDNKLLRRIRSMVAALPKKRIIFSDGESPEVIRAAAALGSDGLAVPVLVGSRVDIEKTASGLNIPLKSVEIIDFASDEESSRRKAYAGMLYEKLQRKGIDRRQADERLNRPEWFAIMSVIAGDADTSVIGYGHCFGDMLDPARQLLVPEGNTVASMHIAMTKKGPLFFADTAVNDDPPAGETADIALLVHDAVKRLGVEPVIAFVSHSNFGSEPSPDTAKMAEAAGILLEKYPLIKADGEMKADTALDTELRDERYPFNRLSGEDVNTLIFPNLSAASITYKTSAGMGAAELTGPVLLGFGGKVYIQSKRSDSRSVSNLALIAAALCEST